MRTSDENSVRAVLGRMAPHRVSDGLEPDAGRARKSMGLRQFLLRRVASSGVASELASVERLYPRAVLESVLASSRREAVRAKLQRLARRHAGPVRMPMPRVPSCVLVAELVVASVSRPFIAVAAIDPSSKRLH
jgi:hypothetical protein